MEVSNEERDKKYHQVKTLLEEIPAAHRLRIIEKLGKIWRRENSKQISEEVRKFRMQKKQNGTDRTE